MGKKFPWVEVGEGMVKRQSAGEPRPGIPDPDVSGRQHPSPNSSLALATHKMPADKDSLLHWYPLKPFLIRLLSL